MSANVPRTDPVSPLVQRLVASSGIFFGVLLLVSILLLDATTPDLDAPLEEWTAYARDNEDNARIGALVFGVAIYNFVLFLGYLRSEIGEAEERVRGFSRGGYMVLIGGVLGIVGLSLFVYLGALSIQEPDTPPETLRAVSLLGASGIGLGAGGFGACLVTVGLVNAAVRALPAWLGWVALVAGIAFLLQLGVLLSEELDNIFGIFFPIAFLLLVVFAIGCSVHWLRGLGRPAEAAPPA